MQITYRDIKTIYPYENNPRINDAAIDAVSASIREFGFKNPVIVDRHGVIIAGHTRYAAAKKLHMTELPCIVADDLDEEHVNALRLADNKTAELAEWDFEKLDQELEEILNIDMEEFGFEFTFEDEENYAVETQDRVENILGLGNGQFEGDGFYDIPIIKGTKKVPKVSEWIGFNYVLSDKEPEGKGVHFFIDDYQFERVWRDPDRYIDLLKRYEAVLAPDFSPYGDMPHACQIFNHYRKHWCAAYMQSKGVNVIPVIRASTDLRSLEWYLEGEPKKSVVAISTMWASRVPEEMREEYETMIDTLEPCHIIVYGEVLDYMDKSKITRISTFTERRFAEKEV